MYKVYQKIILACLLLVMTGTVYSQRVMQTINDGWKFSLFEGDASTADFDISGWTDVSIPHTWNAKDADDEIPGYFRGKGWYRKLVTVEEMFIWCILLLCNCLLLITLLVGCISKHRRLRIYKQIFQ